ncbi:TRAP C4-dicarboxylate transport system permease DctM subunit [Moorella glycerini]|uniref:DctM-like transporter n=1 Tax=Neomoorella stamsii TaxID=1266720 RepID=A0A9X7J114_9FIRM|nr:MULTISPECIES: TRAP transporter fused permease subunit [Moorella]PRR68672.1 DctM-like transporter [Moorella stamsii]CEP68989.1 TRAP C4-dicarboxylate transport system permease DctM subunit [Moorella glycerini]
MARRKFSGFSKTIIAIIAVCWSLFQLLTGSFWVFEPHLVRAIHLAFGATLILALMSPIEQEKGKKFWLGVDLILIAFNIGAAVFLVLTQDTLAERAGAPWLGDIVFGLAVTLIVLEITRRTTGNVLAIFGLVMILYTLWGPYFPGLLAHRGFTLSRVVTYLYDGMGGIYGLPLGVSATFIYMFVLYGNFLARSGVGQFFIDFVFALIGKSRSGTARTLIAANATMATISGVPVASVTSIGALIFPMMRKAGYPALFTGSLGASAAIGATITPPVMGSAAFIMSELTGISYIRIMLAAIIPAALYYLSLFVTTEARTIRMNIQAEVAERKNAWQLLKSGWYNLLPIASLIYFLGIGRSPMLSAFYSIILILVLDIVVTLAKGQGSAGLKELGKGFLSVLEKSAYESMIIMATCAAAGIITGTLSITGLAGKFSSIMMQLSGGMLLPALLLAAVASIILGMGMPIAACYIVLAVIAAPAMERMGVSTLTAHYFIFYFGNFSAITPPVAIAAYAAAGMVKENPWNLSWDAVRICLPTFLVAFSFVYGPSLLGEGAVKDIILNTATAAIGVSAMALALERWLWRRMRVWEMVVMIIGGIMAIFPDIVYSAIGIAAILIIVARLYLTSKKSGVAGVSV